MEENKKNVLKILALIIIASALSFDSIGTIGAGERGIRTRFSAIVGTVSQGLYFKIPFIEDIYKMDVKTRTINYDKTGDIGEEKSTGDNLFGASKDLQDVAIGVVVNYHIDATKVQEIFSQYSSVDNYQSNVIEPMVREIVKSTADQYTAEELVTKRAEFSDKVNSLLAEQLTEKSAILERFSVTSFSFSQAFSQAIETKVAAVQNAEAAKNKLEQVKAEAQQTIEKAKAEAEAIRISAQAISSQGGADYVSLKAVEKWNGVLPVSFVPGSALPFLNIK